MAKRGTKPVGIDPQVAVRARFIEHGTDPAIAKKALEDATGLSRGLWLSFLTFGTYLAITFAGVDHRDLLLETPIILPVLNAPLPLVTFFWVAPILFVIFHLYLLLSLKLLADQVHSYVDRMEDVGLDEDAQDRARLQLPNFVVVQVLGGTSGQINSWAGRLMRFTAWLTLVAGPLILLLFAQLMFLPYHGWWVTMAQRVMVTVDLIFIWYFWAAIKGWNGPRSDKTVYAAASFVVFVLTFFGFMYPGERFYGLIPKAIFQETGASSGMFGLEEQVGLAIFYNTLVQPSARLIDDELFKKLDARNREKNLDPWEGERNLAEVLKYRDFNHANFRSIDLRKAALDFSRFDEAQLVASSLQGASLAFASLNGASLDEAKMQGTNLNFASLQGASLDRAALQGTSLDNASLQGASLVLAKLQGASFVEADLQGVSLNKASLQGASLVAANLHGASLAAANLQGANLDYASVQGASFMFTFVWRSRGVLSNEPMNLSYLDQSQLISKTFDASLKKALLGVPESGTTLVEDALSTIDPVVTDPPDVIDWPKAQNLMAAIPGFKAQMVQSLIATTCQAEAAPYVAQRIVETRFSSEFDSNGDLGEEALPLVEQLVKGCPGTVGINQNTIDQLKYLKEKFTSNHPALDSGWNK